MPLFFLGEGTDEQIGPLCHLENGNFLPQSLRKHPTQDARFYPCRMLSRRI